MWAIVQNDESEKMWTIVHNYKKKFKKKDQEESTIVANDESKKMWTIVHNYF